MISRFAVSQVFTREFYTRFRKNVQSVESRPSSVCLVATIPDCGTTPNAFDIPSSVFVDPPVIPSQDFPYFTGSGRPWWRMNDERTKAVGLDKTLETLRDTLSGNHFDV